MGDVIRHGHGRNNQDVPISSEAPADHWDSQHHYECPPQVSPHPAPTSPQVHSRSWAPCRSASCQSGAQSASCQCRGGRTAGYLQTRQAGVGAHTPALKANAQQTHLPAPPAVLKLHQRARVIRAAAEPTSSLLPCICSPLMCFMPQDYAGYVNFVFHSYLYLRYVDLHPFCTHP